MTITLLLVAAASSAHGVTRFARSRHSIRIRAYGRGNLPPANTSLYLVACAADRINPTALGRALSPGCGGLFGFSARRIITTCALFVVVRTIAALRQSTRPVMGMRRLGGLGCKLVLGVVTNRTLILLNNLVRTRSEARSSNFSRISYRCPSVAKRVHLLVKAGPATHSGTNSPMEAGIFIIRFTFMGRGLKSGAKRS